MSEPVIPKVVEPLVQDSSDCHSQNPVILNNRAPGCEQDNVREFPVQATWTQGLPSKHPDLAEEKKYRLKRKAQITGVLFSYGEDGGEIIVKTTKNKTLSHATKIDPVDIKVYKNFIIYLEEDGDVFVRKFEGETLGEPVLLTTGKDYVELEVSSDGKHLMFFDKKRVCRVAGVDLEKGEVLNSFSLSSNSGEYFLDPSGNCYTIDDDNLTRPDGTNILVKCLVVAGEKGEKRRIISPLSKYVVAALAHSKVVVSEADGSYAVYDKELNEVSRFRSPLGSDAYLWSGGLGEYCALLLRGNEVNQCQLVVYNSATNVWTSQVKNVNGELKLLKGEYRSDIILTRLANGTPVIVTCSQAKKLRLVIYSLPREDSPKVKVIFKQKMKKINGRNELPTDLSVF